MGHVDKEPMGPFFTEEMKAYILAELTKRNPGDTFRASGQHGEYIQCQHPGSAHWWDYCSFWDAWNRYNPNKSDDL